MIKVGREKEVPPSLNRRRGSMMTNEVVLVPNPESARSLRVRSHAGCLDMVAVEGQFTFTAERPQLSCAAFFMAEPNEIITVEYDGVDVDCSGGDFITVSQRNTVHNKCNNNGNRKVRCERA